VLFLLSLRFLPQVTKMPGVIKSFIQDMSWRVRHVAADKFCELAAALGGSMAQSDAMLDDFVRLLSDDEPEVRTAAAARVGEVARLAGGAQTIKKFLKPMGSGKQPGQSVLQAIVADTDEPTAFTRGQ
jgi:serine/threonine-protein phosphatase 2A regulatory subunit A